MLERIAEGADKLPMLAATIPAGRIGKPEEVADAILFVASQQASLVTGQVLHVNGGKTAM
ncbi:hypothetical protein KU43P_22160 [Pseudomonas sp. KU43P]|nr:hypothetical protein KU43P_22160 [Pseudomonas sp. KU43P]